ncbi:MFS transporter [Methylobacterium terrae]|uniref:MFS transporter n=1 Tax=Methylobacterium terrae TaxID=2202827 RepID=A0A2U8WH86_9HYPH|nr:MFS transporter [Methylobacterium terrae]AWN44918.1 MFS transporter [Methylobacterium terrae]
MKATNPTRPTPAERISFPALLAVQLGVTIVTLDISLTSTALPAVATGIGASAASTIWIVNGYYGAVVAALLPLAALGEIHGHRRIFFAGLLVFALGSLACGFAASLPALTCARAVVGIGAAAVSATTPALIRTLYPPSQLGRGLGFYALVVGVAFSVGPTVASAILSVLSWPWLFLMNVPLALATVALALRALPATERNVRPFDGLSAALCAGLFASLLFGIAGISHQAGWQPVALALGASAACGYGLLRREAGHPAPILAVDLFRIPVFALSSATSICAFTIQGLAFVVLPFLLHFRLGYSQVEAGFLITPWPATLVLMTMVAAPLSDRIQPGLLGTMGLGIVTLGLVALALLPAQPSVLDIAWRLMLCGVGFSFFQSPNMRAIMSSAPRERSGGASGILAASRLIGQSLGAAAVAICLSVSPERGIDAAIWIGAAMGALGSGISVLRVLPRIATTTHGHGLKAAAPSTPGHAL